MWLLDPRLITASGRTYLLLPDVELLGFTTDSINPIPSPVIGIQFYNTILLSKVDEMGETCCTPREKRNAYTVLVRKPQGQHSWLSAHTPPPPHTAAYSTQNALTLSTRPVFLVTKICFTQVSKHAKRYQLYSFRLASIPRNEWILYVVLLMKFSIKSKCCPLWTVRSRIYKSITMPCQINFI